MNVTVVNVLLGEAEMDKACATEAIRTEEAPQAKKVIAQRPVLQKSEGEIQEERLRAQENRKRFFCMKKGHLRADCYGWKALQEKKSDNSSKASDGEKDRT